jgi:hypothetical protein
MRVSAMIAKGAHLLVSLNLRHQCATNSREQECLSMQRQRNGLARLIVDPIEGLRRLAPGLGIENVSQRLLCAVQRGPIAVIQPIVLK